MIMRIMPVFTRNLVFYVLYVWSRRNPTANANIWGVPVPAVYLPFAYLALSVFMGNAYADIYTSRGPFVLLLADACPTSDG
jgi:Derlin-2/3